MSEPSNEATNYPVRATISACEVITWIAFRRALPWDGLSALFRASHNRWGTCPPEKVLEALEARAGLAHDGPFHRVWIPDRPRSRDEIPDRDRILTPEGPAILRSIRARLRRNTGRLLGYAELAVMLREDMEADARLSSSVMAARDELRDRAAGGLITVYGIPNSGPGLTVKSPLPEAVPASLFMHPIVTITEWGEVKSGAEILSADFFRHRVPEYEQVQFRTAEVLALWPAPARPDQPSADPVARDDAQDAVALADLPAAWTLTECVAWIMLRDPSVVRSLADPAAGQAGDGGAAHQKVSTWLDIRWSMRVCTEPKAEGCDFWTAQEKLLAALRAGHVHASGCLPDGVLTQMAPAEWRALKVYDRPGACLITEAVWPNVPRNWSNITIPRDAIVAFWPSPVTVPPSDASEGVVYKVVPPHLAVADQQPSMQVQAPVGPLGIKPGEPHGPNMTPTNLSDHLEPQAKRVKPNTGGSPPRHNWDAFWIEVVWYAAKHDLEAVGDRQKLQRYMVEWTSENWESAPDEATIRAKIRALFQARNRA